MVTPILPSNSKPATLVVVLGLIDPKEEAIEVRAAAMAKKAMAEKGQTLIVIGDGKHAPTLKEIHDRIAKIPGNVEVYVGAHGDYIEKGALAASPGEEARLGGHYVVSFKSATPAQKTDPQFALGNSDEKVPSTNFVTAKEFFKQMPSNVKTIFMGTCESERALIDADHLPKGTQLYPSSPIGVETASLPAAVLLARAGSIQPDKEGLRFTSGFMEYNSVLYRDHGIPGSSPPVRYAVSGEGAVHLDQSILQATQYRFSPETLAATNRTLTEFFKGDPAKVSQLVDETSKRLAQGAVEPTSTDVAKPGDKPHMLHSQDIAALLVDREMREVARGMHLPLSQVANLDALCKDPSIAAARDKLKGCVQQHEIIHTGASQSGLLDKAPPSSEAAAIRH